MREGGLLSREQQQWVDSRQQQHQPQTLGDIAAGSVGYGRVLALAVEAEAVCLPYMHIHALCQRVRLFAWELM